MASQHDFFERQDRARRSTSLLVIVFLLAVVGVIVAINVAVWLVVSSPLLEDVDPIPLQRWATSWPAAAIAGATLIVIAGGSLVRAGQLAHGGGGRVATLLGGRIVDPDTNDEHERMLVNVVEEIAVASGMPPPDLYILDHEGGINAFAAGTEPANAAMGFTAGALDELDRDELQGVVAHEFSHVANGDMRLNIRLLALLAGITMIGELGSGSLRGMFIRRHGHHRRRRAGMTGSSRGGGRGAAAMLVIALALIIIGWIGVFAGRLIKARISQQREYLADAAAVQYTRNPDGIAHALMKIAGNRDGGTMQAKRAEEISHMGFTRTVGSLSRLTATHPPIEERLRAISPKYIPEFRQQQRAQQRDKKRSQDKRRQSPSTPATGDGGGSTASPVPGPLTDAIPDALDAHTPGQVASLLSIAAIGALAGAPGAARLDAARALLRKIPPEVYAALHQPNPARRVVWAIFLSEPGYRSKLPPTDADETLLLRNKLETVWGDGTGRLQPQIRLPLIELALPALRELDRDARRLLLDYLDELIRADNRLAVHEYALRTVLLHHLFTPDKPPIGQAGLAKATAAVRGVLSVLCRTLSGSTEAHRQAWRTAVAELPKQAQQGLTDMPEPSGLREFAEHLNTLAGLAPRARREFLTACVACVTSDGAVAASEAEMLRAIAAVVDVPIPPLDGAEQAGGERTTPSQPADELRPSAN